MLTRRTLARGAVALLASTVFALPALAKISVERATVAILPWLVPLLIALGLITFIPVISLGLPQYLGLIR